MNFINVSNKAKFMITKDILILSIVLIISIIFIIVGIKLLNKSRHLTRIGVKTTGTIIDAQIKQRMSLESSSSYKVVEFVDVNSKSFQFRGKIGLAPYGNMSVGEKVSILYDPSNPENASIDDFKERELPWIVVLSIGAFLFLISSGIFVWASQNHKNIQDLQVNLAKISPPNPVIFVYKEFEFVAPNDSRSNPTLVIAKRNNIIVWQKELKDVIFDQNLEKDVQWLRYSISGMSIFNLKGKDVLNVHINGINTYYRIDLETGEYIDKFVDIRR